MFAIRPKSTFLSLIILLLVTHKNILAELRINGLDINTLLKPGQVLAYTNSQANNIAFSIKDNSIELGSFDQLNNISEATAWFHKLENQKDKLYQNTAEDEIKIISGTSITLNGAYFGAANRILLSAHTQLEIFDAILKSKAIFLGGSELKLGRCFIDADTLQLETGFPGSLCQIIRFTFNKDISIPHCVQGELNFEKNETTGNFLVVGAQKVEILFAPTAFEYNHE